MEVWKKVIDNEKYEVSNLGNIRNSETGVLKTSTTGVFRLCYGKAAKTVRLNRLVFEAFNGKSIKTIKYLDGDKSNNALSNLYEIDKPCRLARIKRISNRKPKLRSGVDYNGIDTLTIGGYTYHTSGMITQNGKELTVTTNNSGNKGVRIDRCIKSLAKLIFEAFIGKSKLQISHINGDKSDNRLANLIEKWHLN